MRPVSGGILVSIILTLQHTYAFCETMNEIKCYPISMTMGLMHDKGSWQTISGTDIQKYLAETAPKGCEFNVFLYGDGELVMKDAPKKCVDAAGSNNDFIKQIYPIKYKKDGNELQFEKTISANLPEFGKSKIKTSGYYDLAAMKMLNHTEITSKNASHDVIAEVAYQCK